MATFDIKTLNSMVNRKTYCGPSKKFISRESIAGDAIRKCHSRTTMALEDRNWDNGGTMVDVPDMNRDFNLEFGEWDRIPEYLD